MFFKGALNSQFEEFFLAFSTFFDSILINWFLLYLERYHAERWCLQTTARKRTSPVIAMIVWTLCKYAVLMIIMQADSWQEKWSIPSCRASIWHSTCCFISHALHCSLNSAAFQAESAQTGDHPLWDQSAQRGGIWGARLSGLWGVIPLLNMEIMCKACVPINLSHFFSESVWNLCKALCNEHKQLKPPEMWWICKV